MRVASSIFVHIESVFRRVSSAAKWPPKLWVDSSLKLNVPEETIKPIAELKDFRSIEYPLTVITGDERGETSAVRRLGLFLSGELNTLVKLTIQNHTGK